MDFIDFLKIMGFSKLVKVLVHRPLHCLVICCFISLCHLGQCIQWENKGKYKLWLEGKTGLEPLLTIDGQFLRRNEIDKNLFFNNSHEEIQRRSKLSILDMVQVFISNVKEFPTQKIKHLPMVSGLHIEGKKPDWVHDTFMLTELIKIEFEIFEILYYFYLEEQFWDRVPSVESYVQDIERTTLKTKRIIEARNKKFNLTEDPYLYIASHPIMVFQIMRRFAIDLQPIFVMLKTVPDIFQSLHEDANPDQMIFPTEEDLTNAMKAISQLQHKNGLRTAHVAKGILGNIKTGIQTNALHSLEIAAYYLMWEDYDLALQWLQVSLETSKKSEAFKLYPEIEPIYNYIFKWAIEKHNKIFESQQISTLRPGVFNTAVNLPFNYSNHKRYTDDLKEYASHRWNIFEPNWAKQANIKTLCSGKKLQTHAEMAKLKCWYDNSKNLYWLINPLKIELLSKKSPVFQIHGFIGNKLMDGIKKSAMRTLSFSKIASKNAGITKPFDQHGPHYQAWLHDTDEQNKPVKQLSKLLELLFGSDIDTPGASNAYQITVAGPTHQLDINRHSIPNPNSMREGEGLTEIMGYLGDSKAGGRTGFPALGTFAEPIKGSIVVWNNLHKTGKAQILDSYHRECPVTLGIKWTLSKWIL